MTPQQSKLIERIRDMMEHNVPGSEMERQLLHLIDANNYMTAHNCNLRMALRATAKKRKEQVS
jgi:hypothetical protein